MADEQRITWRADVEFTGTIDELKRLAAALSDAPVRISIGTSRMEGDPHGPPGIVGNLEGRPFAKAIGAGRVRFRMPTIKDVNGGIRSAHMHVGDEVVLLDAAEFRAMAESLASELGGARAGQVGDYVDVMEPIARLRKPPR